MKTPSTNDIFLDIFARLSVLEGVAGRPPRSWTGRGDSVSILAGMAAARKHLPDVSASWFVTDATPLLTALRKGASRASDAMDVVMAVLGGLSRPGHVEGGELYEVGRLVAKSPTLRDAAHYLGRHASHRSGKEVRRASRVLPVEIDMQVKDVETLMDEARASSIMGDDRQWLVKTLERAWATAPGRLAIAKLWLADPSRSAADIAREMGHQVDATGTSTYVAAVIRRIPGDVRANMSAEMQAYVD